MNEKQKTIKPNPTKAILLALLILLPFLLYLSMGTPILSYVLFGLLLAVFATIVLVN
jgi:hypothetical protein